MSRTHPAARGVAAASRAPFAQGLVSLACLTLVLSACGGGDAAPASETATEPGQAPAQRAVTVAASATSATLVVRARGMAAGGIAPQMVVRVNGQVVGPATQAVAASNSFTDYAYSVAPIASGAIIDVVFTNDGWVGTEDRNLIVESITVNGETLPSTGSQVVIDKGAGAAAFDGIDVVPGQQGLWWTGALRYTYSPATPPTNTVPMVVRARGMSAGGVAPQMVVRVDGVLAAPSATAVSATTLTDFSFSAPAPHSGSVVDVVFTNDGWSGSEDRNLVVESITIGGATYPSTGSKVRLDRGEGAAAFDGVDVLAGQAGVWWSGALRFTLPTVAGGTAPTIAGCEMFPSTSIFNTRIDGLPVHPANGRWMNGGPYVIPATATQPAVNGTAAGFGSPGPRVHMDMGSVEDPSQLDSYWGVPYNVVDGTPATTTWPLVAFGNVVDPRDGWQGSPEESDCAKPGGGGYAIQRGCDTLAAADRHFPYPLDSLYKVEGGHNTSGDHHMLMVEKGACRLWESYFTYKSNGTWTALSTAAWDLKSNAMRPAGWTSTDAAGLPVLPLLARADEASAGLIRHALRVTFGNGQMRSSWRESRDGSYTWPGTHAAGGGGDIPFGALIRLKANTTIPAAWTTQAKAIATALKQYGAYAADNGGNLYIQGEPSAQWDQATIDQLATLVMTQFEFVDMRPITSNPKFSKESYQAQW